LSTGGAWCRQPWGYNLLDFMAFQQDGTGRLSVGSGHVLGRAIFHYEVLQPGILSLTFISAPENRRRTPAGLVPWSVDVGLSVFRDASRLFRNFEASAQSAPGDG